jgi:hypothetical protein
MELASESTPSESVEEAKDPGGIAGPKENIFQRGRPLGDRGCDDTCASIYVHDGEPSERVNGVPESPESPVAIDADCISERRAIARNTQCPFETGEAYGVGELWGSSR